MADDSPGLRAEAKGLAAVRELQRRNWEFRGLSILKSVRTHDHSSQKINRLERKKIDLIVVFRRPLQAQSKTPPIFVLQVKSTHKSFRRFCNNRNHKNIKCVLILEHEPLEKVIKRMQTIFEEVLSMECKKNPFFRPRIPLDLL